MADIMVVIDTTQYSGGFDREMCAFITGQVGDDNVGSDIAELAWLEIELDTFNDTGGWMREHIARINPESDGTLRPCTVWPTHDCVDYQSVAIFFDDYPPKEVMEVIEHRAGVFAKTRPDRSDLRPFEITGIHVIDQSADETESIATQDVYHDILMNPQALWRNHLSGHIVLPIDAMREEIERPLRLQIDVLKNMLNHYFELHDDAGTAYLYLGPSPEYIDEMVAQNPQECYNQVVAETIDLCASVVDEANVRRLLKLKGN